MTVTMISAGVLAILLILMSGLVVGGRLKWKIDLGDGGNAAMSRRIRAQANFTEYVPIALILLALVESEKIGATWLAMGMGAVLVVARVWHVQGLLSRKGTTVGRVGGSSLTFAVILTGAVAAIGRGAGAW